jgi:hypothetical protein
VNWPHSITFKPSQVLSKLNPWSMVQLRTSADHHCLYVSYCFFVPSIERLLLTLYSFLLSVALGRLYGLSIFSVALLFLCVI